MRVLYRRKFRCQFNHEVGFNKSRKTRCQPHFQQALDSPRSRWNECSLPISSLLHLFLCLSIMASHPRPDASAQRSPCKNQATEIYYGTAGELKSPIQLRIATGGAGQSGLLTALADAFIDDQVSRTKCAPFLVAWIRSDTTASFNHLADGSADLSITYNAAAEQLAIAQGVADKHVYAWRDHFLLVGMPIQSSIANTFSKIHSFGDSRSKRQPRKPYHFSNFHYRSPLLPTLHSCRRFRQCRAFSLPLR